MREYHDHAARECSRLCYYVAFVEVVQIDEFRDTLQILATLDRESCGT